MPGHGRRLGRLLQEAGDAVGVVHGHDAEAAAILDRHFDRGQRDRGVPFLVEAEHLLVVHLVDVVAGQDDDVARFLAHDGVEVLVDGVGRALVPLLADPLLRRQDLDELVELLGHDAPAPPDVAVEGERLVLGGDEDAAEAGVDAVAEDEVDDPVGTAEIDRRLGAISREGRETLADTPGEHDDQDLFGLHPLTIIRRAPPGDRNLSILNVLPSLTSPGPDPYDRPFGPRI